MTHINRQPAGRPTGGQFAPDARAGAAVSLGQEPYPDQVISTVQNALGAGARVRLEGVDRPDEGMPEYRTGGADRTYVMVDAEVVGSDGVRDRLFISAGTDNVGEPLSLSITSGTDSPRIDPLVDSDLLEPALTWYKDMLPVQRRLNEIAPRPGGGRDLPMEFVYSNSGPSLHIGGDRKVELTGTELAEVWDQSESGRLKCSDDPDGSIDAAMAKIGVDLPSPGGRAGLQRVLHEANAAALVPRTQTGSVVHPRPSGLKGNV